MFETWTHKSLEYVYELFGVIYNHCEHKTELVKVTIVVWALGRGAPGSD